MMIPPRSYQWTGASMEPRGYTRDPRRLPASADNPPWEFCATCGGSGRWYEMNLVEHHHCPACLGVGARPSVSR